MTAILSSGAPDATSPLVPLCEMLDAYDRCLDISRDYVTKTVTAPEGTELDVDSLGEFISIRAELLSLAENSFNALGTDNEQHAEGYDDERRELTRKVLSVLEEVTQIEGRLATYLRERLSEYKCTINQMQKTQVVFKRYSHLGGKIHPSRITRHE